MKKAWVILGSGFVFVSLWVSVYIALDKLRMFGFAQTVYGLDKYLSRDATPTDLIAPFFIAVVITYFYQSKKKNQL
jgi:hypothetical protein